MRTVLISLSALFMTTAAFAMPSVGDDVVFDATITQGNQTAKATVERKLVSFDQNKNTYDQQVTVTFAGQQPQVSDSNVDAANLVTDAQAADAVQNCANYGGTSATVTVPLGTFPVCNLPISGDAGEQGTASVAKVVFGEARQETTKSDGTHIVLELRSQTAGH
jgi:hypothetical protein